MERDEGLQQREEEGNEDEVPITDKHPEKPEKDIAEDGDTSTQQRSRANTDALMAAKGHVTSATLEAELQCIICQYALFKPVSAVCGHSFCRLCLLDSLLTRPIEEAQCPICRVKLLQPFAAKPSLASVFSINVTLWNLGQLLLPSVAERIPSYHREEELEFSARLDQLDAKWKVFTLSERAARYHGDEEQEDARSPGRWEEDREGHDEYPVLKVEDTRDGNLHVSRNVVLDTNDENEDGYVNMRVGIAIVEFPSIFELYNEHQECSVNVIKMEEDEEMADGMPFFMNDDGNDDGFVCSSYYNEISLHVCDEAGNCVMDRTRGAQGGVVTFPGLRLDVPGGMYTFRFSDNLYGLKLSITTRLHEPHEISDTPVADFVSLIYDEASDASRRNRDTHHDSNSEREFDEEGNESGDSFIVDDSIDEEQNEQPIGRFSDDEGEAHWEYHSDDEAADEAREQVRARRRQRSGRRSERNVQIVEEHYDGDALSGEEDEHSDGQDNVDEHEEDEEVDDEVRPGRRNGRVVEGLFSSDGEADPKEHDTVDAAKETETEEKQRYSHDVVRPRLRNAIQIVDSDDEDGGQRTPIKSDREQKADDGSGDAQIEYDEERTEHDNGSASHSIAVEDHHNEEDDRVAPNPTRKVNRAQWFQDEEFGKKDEPSCPDAANEVPERRPQKRPRKVRTINEGESDEEQRANEALYQMEHIRDNEDADEKQFQLFDGEDKEIDGFDDLQQEEDDVMDCPDIEEEDEEKQDNHYS